MKKIILTLVAVILIASGVIFAKYAKSDYDDSKFSASVTPAPLQKGSQIDYSLPDQFGKTHTLEPGTRTLILTFAKESAHTVRNFLKSKPDDYLLMHEAEYIADIHPMPVIIRNMFAMPDLKKSNYPVLLIYDEKIATLFKNPQHKDDIALVTLDKNRVTDITYVKDAKSLEAKLD